MTNQIRFYQKNSQNLHATCPRVNKKQQFYYTGISKSVLKFNFSTLIYHIFKTNILISRSKTAPLTVATKKDWVSYKNINNASMHDHTNQQLIIIMRETHVKLPVFKTKLICLKLNCWCARIYQLNTST